LQTPVNVVETAAVLFVTNMLQQSDMIAVLARDVALYYARHGMVAILPVTLTCSMSAFGIITLRDRLLSPAAEAMRQAIRASARTIYGKRVDVAG